jgi:hypothetical protein
MAGMGITGVQDRQAPFDGKNATCMPGSTARPHDRSPGGPAAAASPEIPRSLPCRRAGHSPVTGTSRVQSSAGPGQPCLAGTRQRGGDLIDLNAAPRGRRSAATAPAPLYLPPHHGGPPAHDRWTRPRASPGTKAARSPRIAAISTPGTGTASQNHVASLGADLTCVFSELRGQRCSSGGCPATAANYHHARKSSLAGP